MRLASCLLLILTLVACHGGGQNNASAVRDGVIDHLAKANYNVAGMDVNVSDVKYDGEKAVATVNVTAKGQSSSMPMTFAYRMEHQNNKWVVVGLANDAGHGAAVDPNAAGGANPHGGGMPPATPGADNPHGGAGKMPSPEDLPPAKKK